MQHHLGQQPNWLENHDTNLFFDQGAVSSIIDWDKAELRPTGEEVIRTMHLSLLLNIARCCAFLDGYRSVTDLSDEQLQQSAVAYNNQRACDLWLYETIYFHGDDRPRRFLSPGRFTPFIDQWESVHPRIAHSRLAPLYAQPQPPRPQRT